MLLDETFIDVGRSGDDSRSTIHHRDPFNMLGAFIGMLLSVSFAGNLSGSFHFLKRTSQPIDFPKTTSERGSRALAT